MKGIIGLTAVFVLGTSVLAKTGLPEFPDYKLTVMDQSPRAPVKTVLLGKGLSPAGCTDAFANRNRQLYPQSFAICAKGSQGTTGFKIVELTTPQGTTAYTSYPFSLDTP